MKPDDEPTSEFRIDDRRHWVRDEDLEPAPEPERPAGVVDEYRRRAEQAEAKLQEYIAAYKDHEREQEQFRVRLAGDVERRVETKLSAILADLLETLDHLDLALAHGDGAADSRALVEGVAMARDGFLATLAQHGVRRVCSDGEPFDPNVAEALRVDAVAEEALDGTVSATLRPGYLLGDRLIRPARVAVARYRPESRPELGER